MGSGGMLPWKTFKFKLFEIAWNAFKTFIAEKTFSDKTRNHEKSFLHWNAWCNNNYSPNRRPCSITEVYFYVELKQPYLLQYVILRGIAPVQDEPRPPFI